MDEWWRHLKGRPFYWALDGTHAPAALYMLQHVVERPERAPARRAARLALLESPQVTILKGKLDDPALPLWWSPRYESVLWTLRLLAELGVPGNDERIATALDRLLDAPEPTDPDEPAPVNLNAIVLHIALAFGFYEDERVQGRLVRLRQEMGTLMLPGTPAALADWLSQAAYAISELPAHQRDMDNLSLLDHLFLALEPEQLPRYAQYGFPTFDQPDTLMMTRSALRLGLGHEWIAPWVADVEEAQGDEGRWRLDRLLPTPAGVRWEGEVPGDPSRWLSAQALFILRVYYGE